MILIVGGSGAGKRAYALSLLGGNAAVTDARSIAATEAAGFAGKASASGARVLCNAQELVRDESARLGDIAADLALFDAVTCEEVGCGVVPVDGAQRAWRERAGRLACELAKRADKVVRMVAGVPCTIKPADSARILAPLGGEGDLPTRESAIDVVLVRHGATPGNRAKRYIGGGTDEELAPESVQELERAAASFRHAAFGECADEAAVTRVRTSGMARADNTARILFPHAGIERIADLREMDFGLFEGKSADDLLDDAAYRAWVDGWCETACPNGESRSSFTARCVRAFLGAMLDARSHNERVAAFVVHGGTIKALLSTLSPEKMDYFAIDTPPGGWWRARFEGGLLFDCERGLIR